MAGFLLLMILGLTVVNCVKALSSVRLLEKNPDAWSRLQQAEDEKRRRRQEILGRTILGGWRLLCGERKTNARDSFSDDADDDE